jgi:hypothetical protein
MHALLVLLGDQLEGTRLAIFTQLIREGGAAGSGFVTPQPSRAMPDTRVSPDFSACVIPR